MIMATIKNFEELIAWQKARELAGNIYALTRQNDIEVKKLINGMRTYLRKSD